MMLKTEQIYGFISKTTPSIDKNDVFRADSRLSQKACALSIAAIYRQNEAGDGEYSIFFHL
jgi:hypothetical protein